MSPGKGPTLRAQWLGKQLREHREQAGLTLAQAGEYLQRDKGTVSRIEAGIIPCRAVDALALLNLYGVDDSTVRDGIERLARDIWFKGWWDGYKADPGTKIIDHAWLESRALGMRIFHASVVPGLLQTEDYARAVIQAAGPDLSPEQVDLWVEFRMKRQRILEQPEPVTLSVILDEAVIRRYADREVMRRQLLHLSMMTERPHVSVRILPFSVGPHGSPDSPFTILDMPEPYPLITQIEMRTSAVYLEAQDADIYDQTYAWLKATALSPGESKTMIELAAESLL